MSFTKFLYSCQALSTAGGLLETTGLLSDPLGLLLEKLFICLKCLGTAEPKGPGLEVATLGDYELSSNWEVSLSDAGGQLDS